MKKLGLIVLLCATTWLASAQVAIGTNTPDASAKFQIDATDKGFLAPRVALTSLTDNTTIASPATGLMVYCNGTGGLEEGFYYWNGSAWTKMSQVSNTQDLGYVLGWPSNSNPPGFLLPLSGGTYNWADYPEFQTFNGTYASQFIASSNATTFTLKDINSTGRFLRGGTTAGTEQASSTKLPVIPFAIANAGAHVHSVDPPSTTSSSDGAHTHTYNDAFFAENQGAAGNNNYGTGSGSDWDNNFYWRTASNTTSSTASNINTSSSGAHTHTVDIAAFNSASNGDHTHTISGGDAETRPINTSIVWCLKVKPTAAAGNITINNVTGITSASNGLTGTPSNVKLGGTLSENTTIANGGNSLSVTGTGSVGIGTSSPSSNAALDVSSTDKGVLLPRMTQAQRNAISSPSAGLLVFCTDCTPVGFSYYNGSAWTAMGGTPTLNSQNSITVTATTTSPSGGTRGTQNIYWEEVGNKIKLKYVLGYTVGGSAGNGDYLFQLPTGVVFNTAANRNPVLTTAVWSPGVGQMAPYLIPAVGGVVYSGAWSNDVYVVPYSSNTFRVMSTWNAGSTYSAWGSGYFALVNNMMISLEFEIWK